MVIMGLIAGISFPAVSAGIDGVRLATAAQSVAAFLNGALNRAERLQRPMEVVIAPRDNRLSLLSNEPGFLRELKLPDGVTLEAILPAVEGDGDSGSERRILFLPGGTVPAIGIQMANRHGARRIVRLDPMTGFPRVESVLSK